MSARLRRYMAAFSLGLMACVVPVQYAGFTIALRPLLQQCAIIALMLVSLVVYRRLNRAPDIQLALEASLWGIVMSSAFNFPMYLVVRVAGAFADRPLASLDARLGFNVPAIVHWAALHPRLESALVIAYGSLHFVSAFAILAPALANRRNWTSELLLALAWSAGLSLVLLACICAVGPWQGAAFSPTAAQSACDVLIRRVHAGRVVSIDVSGSAPLIAFPSWHVILAILSAHTLGKFRGGAAVMAAWAVLVSLSTLTTGWHYGVDVLGGATVAALSIGLSKLMHRISCQAGTERFNLARQLVHVSRSSLLEK